jgi:hypothetical protein
VQVLGRLSRPAPHLGKPAVAVVDFHNTAEQLRDAVAEFYDVTTHCTGARARARAWPRVRSRAAAARLACRRSSWFASWQPQWV